MSLNRLSFSYFPDFFRKEITDQITKIINRGECLQLVGLPGSGKSLLLSAILPPRLPNHLVFYCDLNFLPEKSVPAAFNLLAGVLLKEIPSLNDPQLITQAINQFFNKQKEKNQKTLFVFDDFQNLAESVFTPFFKTLRSFHFHHRPFLQYIFAQERQITNYLPFGPLGTHLAENVLFLPPLNQKEAWWFLQEYEKSAGIKFSAQARQKIIASAGGFMRTLKRLAQVQSSGQDLKEIFQNPSLNPQLNYHLEQLLLGLEPEQPTLKNIILAKTGLADKQNLNALQSLYLVNQNGQPLHPLLFQFLKQKFSQKTNLQQRLTANESKILQFLLDREGQICSKENLITAVWGQTGLEKVADHALDQLLYRLRKKLALATPPLILETIRGRGVSIKS